MEEPQDSSTCGATIVAVRRWVHMVAVVAGCGSASSAPDNVGAVPFAARRAPAGPPLPAPPPVDPKVRGAAFLTQIASSLQPAWEQFLEDCRLRLPEQHPLNDRSLYAVADLVVERDGRIANITIVRGSGNGDFDTAVFDILHDASPLATPTADLESDDEKVHVRWLFARDRRQAGPANGQIVAFELPIVAVVDRWLGKGEVTKAALRVANHATSDPDRMPAAERVMVASLREALSHGNGAVQRAAVEAIARANIHVLAPELHRLVSHHADVDLQLAAIAAAAGLGDRSVADVLLTGYPVDLDIRPQVAIAKTAALVQLGRGPDAAAFIRAELESQAPQLAAFSALGLAPVAELAPRIPSWFQRGDARTRAAICTALPAAAPTFAVQVIGRGMHDADATVRATCIDAIARGSRPRHGKVDSTLLRRLRELARDRDRHVRARAATALAVVDPGSRALRRFLLDDPSPEVRLAMVAGATESELRNLIQDRDPEVRAAAYAHVADRAPDLARRASADVAFQVRRAVVNVLSDDDLLERLTRDDSPEVATAALVRLASRRGRIAYATPLLARLGTSPAASPERVRIALAWLLAP